MSDARRPGVGGEAALSSSPIPPRAYGQPPWRVVVVHGGPGAPGQMAPVARELAKGGLGVLEPLQSAGTFEGQVEELGAVLVGEPKVVIGWSYGAFLSIAATARWPERVAKLILVGSGPFTAAHAVLIGPTRLGRLSPEARSRYEAGASFADLRDELTDVDSYAPLPIDTELIEYQPEVYERVWRDAKALRDSGALLDIAAQVRCPVLAIQGDYDPHPAVGVCEPLAELVADFRCVVLDRCGHLPWIECFARDRFFDILREEVA